MKILGSMVGIITDLIHIWTILIWCPISTLVNKITPRPMRKFRLFISLLILVSLLVLIILGLSTITSCNSDTVPQHFITGKEPSLAVSFGTGRLGNQMSTFASLLAFERIHKVRAFVTARQAEVLESYFDYQNLKNAPMRILQTHFPDFNRFCWKTPFP